MFYISGDVENKSEVIDAKSVVELARVVINASTEGENNSCGTEAFIVLTVFYTPCHVSHELVEQGLADVRCYSNNALCCSVSSAPVLAVGKTATMTAKIAVAAIRYAQPTSPSSMHSPQIE